MPTTTKLITYEESLTMPTNRLDEIIDGESYIIPPATMRHWMLLSHLREALEDQLSRKTFWLSYAEVGLGIQRDSLRLDHARSDSRVPQPSQPQGPDRNTVPFVPCNFPASKSKSTNCGRHSTRTPSAE